MNELPETNSVVTLDATVRSWSDTLVFIDYTITNTGPLELIVFDVGSVTTTGLDDDGLVTLFQAKRDTGSTGYDSQPTIAGRNLSPEQTMEGSASRQLPISIDYIGQLDRGNPETIKFCIGFGTADDIIPTTLTDGTYTLNKDLDLQSFTCTILERLPTDDSTL